MQLRFFYILALMCSCYNQKNSEVPSSIDFDKEVRADDVSFFGTVTYDLGKQKEYTLLFKDNELVRVYRGNKKNNRYYNVQRLNDSVNMIYRGFLAKYFTADTFLFNKNECFHKRVYYSPEMKWEGKTDFNYYQFKENQCDLSEKSYSMQDSIAASLPIIDYSKIKRIAKDTTYTLWKYPDREKAKLTFFRNFFRS